MNDSDTGAGVYKTRTIVRLTQFSAEVLRAWQRRHGLLRPTRSSGGHRLYTEEDLQVLLSVRRLLAEGRSIGEIARIGREVLLEKTGASAQATEPVASPPVDIGFASDQAWPDAQRSVQTVVDAALAMDTEGINRSLDEALAAASPERVISGLVTPASVKIGDLWMAGRCSVANEHLASGIFSHRLRKMIEAAEPFRSDWRPRPDGRSHPGAGFFAAKRAFLRTFQPPDESLIAQRSTRSRRPPNLFRTHLIIARRQQRLGPILERTRLLPAFQFQQSLRIATDDR